MKVKPYQIEAGAWFRKDNLLVNVGVNDQGKYYIRPTTTGGQRAGDYIPDPDKLDDNNQFIKDCLESFKAIVKINQTAFVELPHERE